MIDLVVAHAARRRARLRADSHKQVPAGVEDWADAMRDEIQLLSEARQWMVRDHALAIEKINLLIERFEAIDLACAEHHTAPEMPEDVSGTDEPAVAAGQEATHWFG